jgi:hypothetical protein
MLWTAGLPPSGLQQEVVHCSSSKAYTEADSRTAAFLSSFQTGADAGPGPASTPAPSSSLPSTGLVGAVRRPESVGRLVIESAGSLAWVEGEGAAEQALVRLLYNVRQRVLKTRCSAMVTVPAGG